MNQEKLKTIQFDHLSSWPFWVLIITSIICLVIGLVFYGFESNLLSIVGYLSISLYLVRPFIYKRYVGWNKKGMQLKLGWLKMTSFQFDEIQEVVLEDKRFWIMRMNGKVQEYDIVEIVPENIQRLESLINRCT